MLLPTVSVQLLVVKEALMAKTAFWMSTNTPHDVSTTFHVLVKLKHVRSTK